MRYDGFEIFGFDHEPAAPKKIEEEKRFISQIHPFGVDVDGGQVQSEIKQSGVGVLGGRE